MNDIIVLHAKYAIASERRKGSMIFFDIDGTLLDHKTAELEGVRKFYEKYEFNKRCEFGFFHNLWVEIANKNFNRYLSKELSFEEQRANRVIEVFNEFDLAISYEDALRKFEDYLNVYEESWKTYDDVIPCLEALKDRKLGIISNGDHAQQLKKLEKIGVREYFVDVITAGNVGVAKPNVKIFEIACVRNDVNIEDCYYIGDDVKSDIVPCKEIGMQAILINRTGKEVDEGIAVITSFSELEKVIGK